MWKVAVLLILASCDYVLGIDEHPPLGTPRDGGLEVDGSVTTRHAFARYAMDQVDQHAVADQIGQANAVCTVCPAQTVGKFNNAMLFSTAAAPRLEIEDNSSFDSLERFSVAGWLETTSLIGTACPWGKPYRAADANTWQLCVANNRLEFITEDAGGGNDLFSPVDSFPYDGGWHHVAIVFDGTSKFIYLDGGLVASGPGSTPPLDGHRIVLGGDLDTLASMPTPTATFDGALDELTFYDIALTAAEVTALATTVSP